jgi:ABC-type transport system involved in cytochrome c biogenesis permease subunit
MTKRNKIIGSIVVVMVVGLGAAWAAGSFAGPPAWLVSWTGWLATGLGVLLVPGLLVDAVEQLRRMAGAAPRE